MNDRRSLLLCGAFAAFLLGCGDSGGGVAPVQTQNAPMTAERAAQLAQPDPSLTPEQNEAKAEMAQDQLKRDRYYSQRYGTNAGGK